MHVHAVFVHFDSRLILDVTMLNERNEVFWYRSGYLWLQRYANYPAYYEASLLAYDGVSASLVIRPLNAESTRIECCKITLPLARINGHFKTRYKWVDVACDFLLKTAHPTLEGFN
jgi:hypothetical protein